MGILSWIVMGLIVGVLAKWIMPGQDPGGCIVTTLIGIAGALVGGAIASTLFGLGPVNSISIGNIVIATGGAILLLFIYRSIIGRR